jgi:hypothetical protein
MAQKVIHPLSFQSNLLAPLRSFEQDYLDL